MRYARMFQDPRSSGVPVRLETDSSHRLSKERCGHSAVNYVEVLLRKDDIRFPGRRAIVRGPDAVARPTKSQIAVWARSTW
jgi:hypothetical protein